MQAAAAPRAALEQERTDPPGQQKEVQEVREGDTDGAAATEAQHSLVGPVPQAAGRVAVVGKSCRRRSGGAHRRPSSPRAVEDGVTEGGDLEADVSAGSAHVRATREPPPCRNLGGVSVVGCTPRMIPPTEFLRIFGAGKGNTRISSCR